MQRIPESSYARKETNILVTFRNGDVLLCLLVLNLKMSITNLTRVLFGTPKDYMLQKCVSQSIDHENSNQATNDRITFHLCAYSKLVSAVILNFTKTNPLKFIKNVSLFHLNYSFGSCNMQILGGN